MSQELKLEFVRSNIERHDSKISKNSINLSIACLYENLILKAFPNLEFEIHYQEDSKTCFILFLQFQSRLGIFPNTEWKDVKRYIETQYQQKAKECEVCNQEKDKKMDVTCNKCSKSYCIDCYISIFKAGQGLFTCPFCRYKIGNRMPNDMIEYAVMEIKIRGGLIK